jgi:hypothetical protein
MMARPFALTIWLTSLASLSAAFASNAIAQQPPAPRAQSAPAQPAVAPAAPAAPAAPRREGQPVNVRIDVTITDQRGGGAPSLKKTVSVVCADSRGSLIRTTATFTGGPGPLPPINDVPLNVDVEPTLLADGKIRATVSLQYDLPVSNAGQDTNTPGGPVLRKTSIRENLALVLENGKPLIAAQSADPVGDRQVTIEVKATVLR